MAYSTCCGAYSRMPEIDICPDCMDHCDWEDEQDEEEAEKSAYLIDKEN